jgi:hypothetical protein
MQLAVLYVCLAECFLLFIVASNGSLCLGGVISVLQYAHAVGFEVSNHGRLHRMAAVAC